MRSTFHSGLRHHVKPLPIFVWVLLTVAVAHVAVAEVYVADSPGCRPAGYEELSCGSLGTFVIGAGEPTTKSGCDGSRFSVAEPTTYPQPATGSPWKSIDGWQPCAAGRCFTDAPRGPWVAVVDWDNEHGWSVGETIVQASDSTVEARLFALGRPGLDVVDALPGVGDLHVLTQLCRVADAALEHPPVAVNLSFGRFAEKTCDARRPGTACAIGEVLAHLRQEYGVRVFAAAGNEGQLLYPAADPAVLAVGSMDLRHFGRTGEVRPIPQTPAGAAALFPGNGLFLEERGGSGVWAVPPGSSYASAIASGWWAGYRVRSPRRAVSTLDACSDTLSPDAHGRSVRLACGTETFQGSGFEVPTTLVATALGLRPEMLQAFAPRSEHRVEVMGEMGSLSLVTLVQAQSEINRPTPDSPPCLPCTEPGSGDIGGGGGGNGPGGGSTTSGGLAVFSTDDLKSVRELAINMSRSPGLPSDVELLGVYLEVGTETYRFSDSENVQLLGAMALGKVEQLTIANPPATIDDEPVSLVYSLRLVEYDKVFRSSTPVLLRDR